jgi:hypothetical protein
MALAKRTTRDRNRLAFLLTVVLGLVVLVLWDWQSRSTQQTRGVSPHLSPKHAASGPEEQGHHINPLSNLALDELHDTLRRPLFEKKRRPPAPAPAKPVAAPVPRGPDPIALTLVGVLTSEQQNIALLKRKSGQDVRAQEGDMVDGWIVDHIEPQQVVLRQGASQIVLKLFRKPSK